MKKCSTCKVEKDRSEFGQDVRAPDGLKYRCRECTNAYKRSRPTDVKAMERRSYRMRNRDQVRVQKAVRKAIGRGTLVRPDACDECGAEGPVHAHHDDYSLRFEVRWLCVTCHAATHMARMRVDMRLPEELVAAVDEARGDVTRTRWVERALERALETGPSDSGPVEQGASVEAGTAPSRAPKPIAPVDPVLKDPPAALPKIAKRHWS